jgi:adenosine deaminase
VTRETALELASAHGVPAPAPYRYSDLTGFLAIYRQVCECMRTADDFERVIVEHARSMAEQRIEYAEISFNPGLHAGEEWLDGVKHGRRAARELGVEIAWLVELSRGDSDARNQRSLDVALSTEGVVGIGLVGDESLPSDALVPFVARAHEAGLRFMPHAGQAGGPEVVREAVEVLHADRIAHGVASLQDAAVLSLLADRGICLCVCPSSNARIGLRPDYRKLAEAGVALTVNSDDPAMVGTTLAQELELAETSHGLHRDGLIAAAWEFTFSD